MFKSAVFHGNSFIGEVEIYPQNTNAAGSWIRELRISHFSPPSERCPPIAVLHTIVPGGARFKMESRSPTNDDSPLSALHAACLRENKTAVVSLGEEEVHLVAMTSQKNPMRTACFWGFHVATKLYDYSLVLLNMRCLGIVFDLDETLILANTQRSFEDRIDALQRKMNNETDPQRITGILAEIKRYQDDQHILKQYTENDQVIDNGKTFKVQSEVVQPLSDSHQVITRPIIRLQEKNIILTRINPSIRDTSVLVRLRPAWEDLRSYLTARGRKRFEVYVCTMAERDYALEMWRLLDPDSNLIDSTKLLDRIVCVKSGMRKSLLNVFQGGICHPKMALVIDDRLKVWDERDQPRVHVVPAFAPYYAPQAEASNNIPVLCVARNVACNVRGGFFKEFDEVLLPQLSEVLYEDDLKNIQSAPDVGNFLVSEDDSSTPNVNRDQQGLDGMAGAEVERRLKEASCNIRPVQSTITSYEPRTISSFQQVMPSSGAATVSAMQVMMPLSTIQGPQPVSLGRSLGQVIHPEPSFQCSPAREEGEVPESELDPDTRRRLLILQHGQDSAIPPFPRDPTPPFPVRPPLNISLPSVQPTGSWFPVEEEINTRQVGRTLKEFNVSPETSQYNNKRTQHPSFYRGEESSFPPQRVHEKRRLPFQLNHGGGGDNERTNHGASSYNSFQGEDTQMGRTFLSHKLNHFEPGQAALQQAESPAGALEEIAAKCGTKVEFRSALCDTTELQFLIEVWLVGEKIGEGIGRTRKEAQHKAAEISLRHLADKYVSNAQSGSSTAQGDFLKQSQSKENGFVNDLGPYPYQTYNRGDILPVASTSEDSRFTSPRLDNTKGTSPVSSLKELCSMEGYSLAFQPQPLNPTGSINKGQESAQVEVSGKVLGRGVGATWDEAKHQAAEQALGALRSMLGQFAQKQSSSPRSLPTFPNKRLKPDFPRALQ